MAKQLRLDVAQLTDVGRRREHNEDNMAYVIPKDPQVMALKGSLFIVADGMGGHAAGEVASEIAVDTVSNVYYQDDSDDIPIALVRAIKRANAAIHQRAAENMLRSGMGTTCVAAVLRGNTAYIANVGDSRAYLIRGGAVKQISQDHSWVAEQVRAGLLTEDQARTHAQRNVITRSLGTQPDVDIDIFTEPLQENDSLVLCTDGLSGLITEDELQRIVNQFVPQESVYHLVERANENGGPDNITAIVIHVNEVGWEPPRQPVAVGGPEQQDTMIMNSSPASGQNMTAPTRQGNGHGGAVPFAGAGSSASAQGVAAAPPAAAATPAKPRRSRLFYPTIVLLVLFLLAIAAGGVYYFVLRPGPNVDQSLAQAKTLIDQASTETTNNPGAALQHLSSAQRTLQSLQSAQLTSDQHSRLLSLQQTLTADVKAALLNYNRQFGISALPCTGTINTPLNNGSTNTQARSIAALSQKGKTVLYALGVDNNVYPLGQVVGANAQYGLTSRLNVDGQVSNMAATNDGSRLFLLITKPGQNNKPPTYEIGEIQAGQQNVTTQAINASLVSNGQIPALISAWGGDVYVVFTSPQNPSSAQIVDYDGGKLTQRQNPVRIAGNVVSLAAFPNNQLFLLMGDGTVQSLQYSGKPQAPSTVLVQQPIASVVPLNGPTYSAATPVPTVSVPTASQNGSYPLQASNKGALATGMVDNTGHLYIVDAQNHRILDLVLAGGGSAGGTSGLTLQLKHQYTSTSLLAAPRNAQVDPSGAAVYVLSQNAPTALNVVAISTNPQSSCA